MKTLFMNIALWLSVTAQAQTRDSIDVCQFVVVYDHLVHTFDKDGNAMTDSAQIAVQVGSRVTKCAEFNLTMMNDFGEGGNRDYQLGEWYARVKNVPTLYLNHPEGEMRVFDKVIPQRYTVSGPHTFTLSRLITEAEPITYSDSPDFHKMKQSKLTAHKNKIFTDRRYLSQPTYYVPDLLSTVTHMEVFNLKDGTKAASINGYFLPPTVHVYQPLEKTQK